MNEYTFNGRRYRIKETPFGSWNVSKLVRGNYWKPIHWMSTEKAAIEQAQHDANLK